MHAWIDVAELAHTKNLNGGLVARSTAGLPLLLAEGARVALVPPVLDAPRDVTVARVSPRDDREALVFFKEVADASAAEMLVGCHCLVRRDSVDWQTAEEERGMPFWEGWSVWDEERGLVGTVAEIEDRPLQPLLHIARPTGEIALVPLVDEFLVGFDEQERRIDLSCPAGLLDL